MYDKEDFLFDVVSKFQNNLNTEITAVNTDKGDSLLDSIDSNAFFIQEAGEESFNFNPFVFFYVGLEQTESIDSSSMDEMKITALVVFQDEISGSFEMVRKLLRYQRAMKSTVENNFEIVGGANRIKVSGVEPIILANQDSNRLIKTCGIEITSFIN